MNPIFLCRGKINLRSRLQRRSRLQKEVIPMEKKCKKPEFWRGFHCWTMKLVIRKLTYGLCLIDVHISNLEKKIENNFPTSESSPA